MSGLVCFSLSYLQPAVAAPSVQVGFSPEGSALQLVLKTIESAQHDIRLMGYSFISPEVVKALVAAKKRGVEIKIVLNEKGNRNKASLAAMNILVNAGIPIRTNSRYAIMHDKVMMVDGQTVETPPSASRRILMICSSEKRFFMGGAHVVYEDITNIAVHQSTGSRSVIAVSAK